VLLVEQHDLAWGLPRPRQAHHGGLRYLEYTSSACRESLAERETLLANPPHIVWPMEFVLPQRVAPASGVDDPRGLFSTTNWGTCCRASAEASSLPRSKGVRLAKDSYGTAEARFRPRFVYYDCWSTTRACDAQRAIGRPARRDRPHPHAPRLRPPRGRRLGGDARRVIAAGRDVRARALVNAAGPWVNRCCTTCCTSSRGKAAAGEGQPHRRAARPRGATPFCAERGPRVIS